MFEDGLENSEGPAESLPHQSIGGGRSLGKGEGHVFIFDAIAVTQKSHGQIGVFGYGVDMIAAGLAYCFDAPGADRSGDNTYSAHGVKRAAFKVLAGDVFEGLPARPEIDAVADLGVAGYRSNFWIEEVGHHAKNGVGRNDGVGVDADEKLGVADVLEAEVEGLGFAAVGLGENYYFAGSFFGGEGAAGDFQCSIFGAVVDYDHAQIGVIGIERGLDGAFYNFFFVVGGDKDGYAGAVRLDLFGRSVDVRAEAIIDGENANRNQSSGHEDVAQEKNDGDGGHDRTGQPEANPI